MLLMLLLIFHLEAVAAFVSAASAIRSLASLSVKMPFCTSLLISASAEGDWARAAVPPRLKARVAINPSVCVTLQSVRSEIECSGSNEVAFLVVIIAIAVCFCLA